MRTWNRQRAPIDLRERRRFLALVREVGRLGLELGPEIPYMRRTAMSVDELEAAKAEYLARKALMASPEQCERIAELRLRLSITYSGMLGWLRRVYGVESPSRLSKAQAGELLAELERRIAARNPGEARRV